MRSLARPLAQYPEWWALLAFEALFWLARPLLTDHSLEWLVAFGGLGFLMLSGAALVILLGDDGNWWERLSLAFVASVSLPSLVAQIFMLAHTSIQAYAVAYLALMLVLVAAALLRIARHTRAGTTIHTHVPAEGRTPRLLILFLAIALLGHYVFWTRSPLNSDEWNALSWIQNIRYDQHMMTDEPLYGQQFGVTARYEFVPWLAQQAMISYAVGMDPVDLLVWIRLPLFLLSLSAVYRFARAITRRREAAALGTLAWSLYLFYWINGNYPGYELSVRADLDKILSGFMLLPIVLGLTMRALQSGGVRSWLWLLLGAIAGGLMHPLAMGLIGLCLVGMGSLDVIGLLDNPRSSRGRGGQTRRVLRNPSGLAGLWRAVATRVGVNQWRVVQRLLIAALILAVGLIPSLAALTDLSENPLGAALSSVSATSGAIHDPSLARNLNFALVLRRLWILDTGQYII
ncbi:MAG: hypothetical protein HY259_00035, partial [Chloroflexi bacterium]|nr:hypothetical protein [Chloroflexota bacterium]